MWDEKKFFDDYIKAQDNVKADDVFWDEMKNMLCERADNTNGMSSDGTQRNTARGTVDISGYRRRKVMIRTALAAVFVLAIMIAGLRIAGFFAGSRNENYQTDSSDIKDKDDNGNEKKTGLKKTDPESYAGNNNEVKHGTIGEKTNAEIINDLLGKHKTTVIDEKGNTLTAVQVEELKKRLSKTGDKEKSGKSGDDRSGSYDEYCIISQGNDDVAFRIYESGSIEILAGND